MILEGEGFAERARAELPDGADGVVDLIGARAVLDSLQVVRRGGTVCNSGLLGGEWVIDDFQPIENIPSGRKLTAYHSDEAADAGIGGPLLRAVVEQVERGEVDPVIDTIYTLDEIADAHRRMAAGAAMGKLVVLDPARVASDPGRTLKSCSSGCLRRTGRLRAHTLRIVSGRRSSSWPRASSGP